ncbi:ATP-binding cassette domain-containing protein [Psychromonas sp. RZ22]|uniref:ATP-binding cassette domain-containing protein n=1 Tax=Psychromonas algarum TaxID=2555643 RepID=UPI00106803A1|nr:ATP-binding cassette domain-containing protein [Psychromonas sp. RZ22]TEW54313.1 ATP-binding cassette domain-containing protein [Psychromonas sp. RZ22]
MINIVNFVHDKLTINNWQVNKNESWCVLGRNGSGKQYINQLLTGDFEPTSSEQLVLPQKNKVGMISFKAQQETYENELIIDATDYADVSEVGTKAKEFLPEDKWQDPLISEFGLSHRLDTGYLQLSTGESRKLLILQAIFSGVEILVCDNPFDSLDIASCEALSNALDRLSKTGITIILMLSNRQDIPEWCTNIAFIERGQFTVIGQLEDNETKKQLDVLLTPTPDNTEWPENIQQLSDFKDPYLVKLTKGTVHYNGVNVFEDLDVAINPLQHTLITGANGSGKSTLMQLITGDCPQCYSNDIHVLGYKRGSGESIWELKKQMGIVSAELHRQYRVNGELLTVVLSGFYDSIGMYQQATPAEIKIARQWLDKVGLLAQEHTLFKSLSYGEQRLVLILRALVKSPYLIILDEPTQGLDELNRHRILNFLEHLEQQKHSTMLLVSHRRDEFLALFKQHIKL